MVDFDTAYSWLNTFSYSCLGVGTRQLVLQLSASLGTTAQPRLRSLLNKIAGMIDGLPYRDEQAECLLACGLAAYHLNALADASGYLDRAAALYSSVRMAHQRAVSTWLQGWVLWNMPAEEQYLRGLALLQDSVRQFQTLAAIHLGVDHQRRGWYTARSAALTQTIHQQVQMIDLRGSAQAQEGAQVVTPTRPSDWKAEYPVDLPDSGTGATPGTGASPGTGEESGTGRPSGAESISIPRPSPAEAHNVPATGDDSAAYDFFLQTFEVRDSITAGGLKAMNMDSEPLGHLEVDRVLIDGACYRIVPLKRNGSRARLTRYLNAGQRLVVLKVKGDSMNRCTPTPIYDGDYVMVAMQNLAQDGDIVVAGVSAFDQEATLKRFRPRGPVVELEPESDNPAHVRQSYPARGGGFFIAGVALAVFKPVD